MIKNPWMIGFIFLILGGLISWVFYTKSISKEDYGVLIEKIDKNEEYAKEIEFLEKYKRKFLQNSMNLNYVVFGVNSEGNLITKEQLLGETSKFIFSSKLSFDFEKMNIHSELYISEIQFPNGSTIHGPTTFSEYFPIVEDKFFDSKIIQTDDEDCLKFVLLKSDYIQPVFAIGMGECEKN